jgi:hypothetical protein
MGKLPTITRLLSEDVPPEQREWFDKMLTSLNSFISTVLALLNKGLNFQDNMDAMVKTLEFDGRNLASKDGEPLSFKYTTKGPPVGCLKVKIVDITDSGATAITAPVDVQWSADTNGKVNITSISNIATNATYKYRITLLVF